VSESVYAPRIALLFSAKMTEQLEQRYCIKFCQKLGGSQVETIRKIQRIFSDSAMDITQVKEWYNQFKDGRTSVESDAHSGRPSTSQNDELIGQVRTLVMQDHRVTIRELVEEVGISTGSLQHILTDDFGHVKSVCEIHAEAANDGAEATQSGSLEGHAGLRKQRP